MRLWVQTVTDGLWRVNMPQSAAGAYLPRINIKSQKIVSPKAGWQEGKEGKEASSPEGSNKHRENKENRHQGATERGQNMELR